MSEALKTAVSTALTSIKTDVFDTFETALPIALTIVGVGIAVTLGIKFFKKISNKA